MSTKTNFKRIALAVVAALGLGVMASGPSNAAVQAGATMTLASSTASITAGETATAVVSVAFTSIDNAAGDSMSVTAIRTTGTADPAGTVEYRGAVAADSSNVGVIEIGTTKAEARALNNSAAKATFRFDVRTSTAAVAGTYAYTFYAAFNSANTKPAAPTPVTFTITVSTANLKPSATTSKVVIGATAFTTYASTATDSVIAVAAGTVGAAGTAAAVVAWSQLNSKGVAAGAPESVTVRINGAGALKIGGVGTAASAVIAKHDETVTVFSDGRTGVGTVSLDTTSMANWATKTLTFSGTATKATIAVPRTVLGTYASSNAVRITPLDSGNNLVTTAVNMYLHSSDTKVVKNSVDPVNFTGGTTALGYSTGSITALLLDSGTAKIKFANFAAESTTPTTGAIVTNEVDVSVVGSPKTFTITLDKTSYTPGEIAKVSINVFDGLGKAVADTAIVGMLTTAGITVNGTKAPGTDETVTVVAATHGVGKYTFEYTMPTAGSDVVFKATGSTNILPAAGQVAFYETVTVINPAEDAANEALDAAIAATDAAILAEEAAANAEAAATAAAETAEAALDAVTALSAQVTKLVAQLASLQKLVNKIAKRVGAKK